MDLTDSGDHVTAVVYRDPGATPRGWCICGWYGPERLRLVHVTLDRKSHLRQVRLQEARS